MHVQAAITIDRPINEVFAYLSDIERRSQWVGSTLATQKTSDGPVGLGATHVAKGKILGRRLELAWEITAYEPPHTIQQRTRLGAAHLVVTMTLEATTRGTKVTVLHEGESGGELDLPDTRIAGYLKKQSAADLEVLRTLVEAGATAAPV